MTLIKDIEYNLDIMVCGVQYKTARDVHPLRGQEYASPSTQMLPLSLLGLAFHLMHLSLGFPGELLSLSLALAHVLLGLTLD